MTPSNENAQVFCLGAPLRLVAAYSKRLTRREYGYSSGPKYHFLEIIAGPHVITIMSSQSGKSVKVMMDGRELS